jgi:predicted metal-binding protein
MKHKIKKPAKKAKLSDSELCKAAKQKSNVIDARMISPADVETAPWVRLKCKFGCRGYGRTLVCPPYTPTPQQMREVLDSYKRAVLIHFEREPKIRDVVDHIKTTVVELEQEFFLRGAWKAFGLGAGSCSLCEECNLKEQLCKHAKRARPAMEACGIDVFSTVKKAGFPIKVVRTRQQCPNYYGLILVD